MSEESSKMFTLRLAGEGINIEQQIEQRLALQVVQIVMGGSGAMGALQSNSAQADSRSSNGLSLSLREHLDKIGASKKPEQIAAIAHYLCEVEGHTDFSRDDIKSRFITAREPPPGNFARDFALAVKNGWIAEIHGKKNRFYVTARGAQAINSNFSNGKGATRR